jgi:hypothetical protein
LSQNGLDLLNRFLSVIKARRKVFGSPIDSIACVRSQQGIHILVQRLGRQPAESVKEEKRENEQDSDGERP